MAPLAGVPRRTQVFHGRGDGRRIGFKRHGVHLPQPGKLRTHEPTCPGTNVALHAFDSRVRRILVRTEFRRHHRVARLSAKSRRVHIRHALVRRIRKNRNVQGAGRRDEQKPVAHHRKLQVDGRIFARQFARGSQFLTPQQDSQRDQQQAKNKHPGQDQEKQNPDVWVRWPRQQEIVNPEGYQRNRATRRQHDSDETDDVLAQVVQAVLTNPVPYCADS